MKYNEEIAKQVEDAVMQVYGCRFSEIVGCIDTPSKKVVVFILSKLFDFDKRNIAVAYSMTYLYVPTVVDEIEMQFIISPAAREKIINVSKLIGYESKTMDGRRIEFVA